MKNKNKFILLCLFTILFTVHNINLESNYGTYTVQAASVTMNKNSLKLLVGNDYTLRMNGTNKTGKWYSANKNIATVDSDGKITALKAGKTNIYVKINNKKYQCKLTVTNPKLNYKSFTLDIDDSIELKLAGTKGKIKWNSSQPSIASVNSKGRVTAKAPGKVDITASVGNSTYVCKVTVNNIEVYDFETILEVTCLYQGETAKIQTVIYPANATIKTINYQSSDENIAKVDSEGVITAINVGTVDISATSYNGLSEKIAIEIIPKPIVSVRNTTIQLGEYKETIISKVGQPSRIAKSNYGDETYVYADDYNKLLFLYMKGDMVVGLYTNSNDFVFDGVNKQSSVSQAAIWNDRYNCDYFVDNLGANNVDGIFLIEESISLNEYTDEVLTNMEREVFDITNSYRAQNNLQYFVWSDAASVSSRKHSADMANNDYFSHTSLSGISPFERMKNEGITYSTAAENIAAGYTTSFEVSHGWYQSAGHRKNMLNSKLANLGVGIASGGSYSIYSTQNFYTGR